MNAFIVILLLFVAFTFFGISGYACYKAYGNRVPIEGVNLFGNLLPHRDVEEGKEYSLI